MIGRLLHSASTRVNCICGDMVSQTTLERYRISEQRISVDLHMQGTDSRFIKACERTIN